MQFSLRFLVILTGWLIIAEFSVGMVSIVNAETDKMKPVKISSDQRYAKFLDGTTIDKRKWFDVDE